MPAAKQVSRSSAAPSADVPTMRGPEPGTPSARIRRVDSSPSIRGMTTSIRMTS